MPHYAVAKGKVPGVYSTWPKCQEAVDGYPYAKFRKFDSYEEAQKFVEENRVHSSSNRFSNKRSFPANEITPKR